MLPAASLRSPPAHASWVRICRPCPLSRACRLACWRNMPLGLGSALVLTVLIYMGVSISAASVVPWQELAEANAPLVEVVARANKTKQTTAPSAGTVIGSSKAPSGCAPPPPGVLGRKQCACHPEAREDTHEQDARDHRRAPAPWFPAWMFIAIGGHFAAGFGYVPTNWSSAPTRNSPPKSMR